MVARREKSIYLRSYGQRVPFLCTVELSKEVEIGTNYYINDIMKLPRLPRAIDLKEFL